MISRWLLSILLLACSSGIGLAQTLSENELKAAFLYRFSQFSKWPESGNGALDFCVVGNHELYKAIVDLLLGQKQLYRGTVKELTVNGQVKSCNVLFLSQQSRQQTQYWLEHIDDEPILVVADTSEGFRQGAVIGLIAGTNNLSFRINLTSAKRRGLNFSAHLLKLASEVR
ncbi:YfiR family protein [Pseudoalteromonas sp. T1lg65]|uniref:YfiR family protein n=1 Tax=Pseudoalteromonas sp. T1lg65 TaxID=2077101 RepID=UPI003F7AFC2E